MGNDLERDQDKSGTYEATFVSSEDDVHRHALDLCGVR